MAMARALKSWSSEPLCFSWQAFTDWASMRAWAGSYTPQGRSKWASTVDGGTTPYSGVKLRSIMDIVGAPFAGVGLFNGDPRSTVGFRGRRLHLTQMPEMNKRGDAGARPPRKVRSPATVQASRSA